MKKMWFYFGLLAVAVLLFACQKETNSEDVTAAPSEEQTTDPAVQDLDPDKYLVAFSARIEQVGTRVSIDVTEGALSFEEGDEVLVVTESGETGIYVYNSDAVFAPKDAENAVSAVAAKAYYPAGEFAVSGSDVTFTLPTAISAGSAEDLGDKLPMAAVVTSNEVAQFKVLGSVLRARFNSAFEDGETITDLELTVAGANITGSGTVSWTEDVPSVASLDGTTSIKIGTANGHLTHAGYKEFYFFLPASGTLTSMTLKAIYGKADGYEPYETISRTSAMALAGNKIFKVEKSLSGFFSGGDGSEAHPYLIASADDFKVISTLANATEAAEADKHGNGYLAATSRTFFGTTGVHYLQTADIDFSNADIPSIGVYNALPFQGGYDGDGKTLSKFKVVGTQAASTGLFEYVDGATLKNISIGTCFVTGENVAGVLTGRCIGSTSIEGCSFIGPGNVQGRNSVGFVAHISGSTTVKNCTVSNLTVITAESGADANNQGGIVGWAGNGNPSILNCSTSGNIQFTGTVSGSARGGIVGKFDSTGEVNGCTNDAVISNGLVNQTGGIVGSLANGSIVSCANTASVSGTSMVGGIVGFAGNTTTNDSATNITFITSCRNAADVTGSANCVGGIAGKLQNGAVMSACYAQGNVTTSTYDVGGLTGLIQINNNNATSRIYVYDCIANMNVSTSRTSGACRTGGAVGNITIGNTGQYVAVDNCGVLDVTITAGGEYVGGFAGWMTGDAKNSNRARIRNCYTLVGSVPGSAKKGGFIGAVTNKAELRYCYFVTDDSSDISTATTANYSKKTATEIKSDATCTTFNGNNFTLNVGSTGYSSARGWAMINGYPVPGALINLGSEYYK